MVPATGMPKAWPAATFDVACTPARYAARDAASDASAPVRVPQAEVDDRASIRRRDDARRFGRHRGGQLHEIEQPGLDELSLGQRRVHGEQRLVGKERRALGQRVHAPGKAEPAQIVEKLGRESTQRLQVLDVRVLESQVFEVVERGIQAGGDQEVPIGRQASREELERRGRLHAVLQVCLEHGELIEIGGERVGRRRGHRAPGLALGFGDGARRAHVVQRAGPIARLHLDGAGGARNQVDG